MPSLKYMLPLILPIAIGAMSAFAHLIADFSKTVTVTNYPEDKRRLRASDFAESAIEESPIEESPTEESPTEESPTEESPTEESPTAVEEPSDAYELNFQKFLLNLAGGIIPSMLAIDIWALTLLLSQPAGRPAPLPYEYPLVGVAGHFLLLLAGVALGLPAWAKESWFWTIAVTLMMLLAVSLGWYVRDGIWKHYEMLSEEDHQPTSNE